MFSLLSGLLYKKQEVTVYRSIMIMNLLIIQILEVLVGRFCYISRNHIYISIKYCVSNVAQYNGVSAILGFSCCYFHLAHLLPTAEDDPHRSLSGPVILSSPLTCQAVNLEHSGSEQFVCYDNAQIKVASTTTSSRSVCVLAGPT